MSQECNELKGNYIMLTNYLVFYNCDIIEIKNALYF